MIRKIIALLLILMSVFAVGACSSNSNETSSGAESSEQWPTEYMSVIPKPEVKISSIQKLNGTEEIAKGDTSTKPSSVNVVMNDMSKKEANDYYEKLKKSGFTINSDENTDDKILLVGVLNDTEKNPFLFSYIPDEKFGNISITILKEVN